MDVEIVKSIAQPAFERAIQVCRNETRRRCVVAIEVLQNDARLRDRLLPSLVAYHGELRHRPEAREERVRLCVTSRNDDFFERHVELVEADERLVAKRRERMII